MSAITSAGDPLAPVTAAAIPLAHPTYTLWSPIWRKLIHVFEGSGGFLDGTYLIAHPREWEDYTATEPKKPTKKLTARRSLARYENFAATILDQKRAALFRKPATRMIGESSDDAAKHPLYQWWQNVDGRGTTIDEWMQQAWVPAALFGHLFHVMDRRRVAAQPLTKADEPPLFLRLYSPLDAPDWLQDDTGALTALKLLEIVPRASLEDSPLPSLRYQQRFLTETDWKIQSENGTTSDQGPHTFGRLPVVVQYTKRRALSPLIGQSVLNDPQLFIDLYNLTSETRELLRLQTFSILNVPLGTGDQAVTVEKAIEMMGSTTGAENVLFTPDAASFIEANTGNVATYQAEREHLLRTIYRLASIPWEADSKDAEAQGSLKLKREDMNQVLASYAAECEQAEYAIAELWFRGTYGKDRWQEEMDKADVTIRYPDTFDVTPFAEILEQAQAAIALEMPPTFMKELRRRIAREMLPDAAKDLLDAIDTELEQQAKEKPQDVLQRATSLFQKIAAKAPDQGGQAAA